MAVTPSSERGMRVARPQVEPHLFICIGGTGDLMRLKLLPALRKLAAAGHLRGRCHLLGVARRAQSEDGYRAWAREALAGAGLSVDADTSGWCDECVHYQALGDATDGDYRALAARIRQLERAHGLPGNRVFYLAIPPTAVAATVTALGTAGLSRSPGWTRVVVEKPFGHDLASAHELNRLLHEQFDELQIYRIDHYLAKETVQNLLVFRFANSIFESVWNRDRVASVQITVAQDLGVEGRGRFYDRVGALRDMIQNHLTQLLTLTAMEAPVAFEAEAVRDEKAKVLRAIPPIAPEEVVYGQYAPGEVGGEPVPGYLEEEGVSADSTTETFVALRAYIANWRWQGVPFYLRTGKRLPTRVTQIHVHFRCPVLSLFAALDVSQVQPNTLIITLEPDEGFDLSFQVKAPEEPVSLRTQSLHFRYSEAFGPLPEAYETLLLDVIEGDQTLFVRFDEVEAAWRIYTPLLERQPQVHPYAAGTWGPPEADRFTVPGGLVCPL